MVLVVNLLFGDVSVLQIMKGAKESVQRIVGLNLQGDGVKDGLSKRS